MKFFLRMAMVGLAALLVCAATGDSDLKTVQSMVKGKKGLVWVFTGDSITHGALHTKGWRSYPEIVQERLRWEMRRYGDAIINTGISGDIVSGILGNYHERIGKFKPDIVSVKIGMNDCRRVKLEDFSRDLGILVDSIRADNAIPILLTPNTVNNDKVHNASLTKFVEVMRGIAKVKDVVLIDHLAKWEKEAKPDWYNDKVHPNGRGHLELAREFLKTFGLDQGAACLNIKFKEKE